jgi:hypothetical protein
MSAADNQAGQRHLRGKLTACSPTSARTDWQFVIAIERVNPNMLRPNV